MKQIFAFLLGTVVCGATSGAIHAQVNTPASSGVYTAPQAERGAALYQSKCGTCHGAELAGDGTSPPLAGPDFLALWTDQPLFALFDKIRTTMPSDHPGSLSATQTADMVAFLLRVNRYPAGQTELPPVTDRLKQILFDKAP